MRKSRFAESQIVEIFREFDAGAPAGRTCASQRDSCEHDPSVPIEIPWNEHVRSGAPQATRGREPADAAHYRSADRQGRRDRSCSEKNSWGLPGDSKP